MTALYHRAKTPISFWCRWGLNLRYLIQPLKTLPVKLIKTHLSTLNILTTVKKTKD